jgi:glycerol-3-phosphate dehydrogenase (NAD(P)+)
MPHPLGAQAQRTVNVPDVKVSVIGAGSWGTTLASQLATRATTVLWARETEVVESITVRHENPWFLPGFRLTPDLRATSSMEEALAGADVVMMAVPSKFFRVVLAAAGPMIPAGVPILSLAKGIEETTLLRMTEVAVEVLPDHDPGCIGVLSGPNIAREVIAGEPAATVVAFPDQDVARRLQQLFLTDRFRVYTNTDVVGCELAGAVKNVIAVAVGMAVGLGYGANSQGALMTRGLAELTRLGVALGGAPLTFLGLAGVGDLFATCSSPRSRNNHVGTELGRGRPLAHILAGMRMVAEGVETARPTVALAARMGVEVPIAEQVVAVLEGAHAPADAVALLMGRAVHDELHDLTWPGGFHPLPG